MTIRYEYNTISPQGKSNLSIPLLSDLVDEIMMVETSVEMEFTLWETEYAIDTELSIRRNTGFMSACN